MCKKTVIEQMIGLLRTPIAQRKGINIPPDECLIWAGELENELKSLISNSNEVQKPQNTWKPSNEQMKVLLSEVTGWKKGCPKQMVLESLYNDLKKLK